LATSAFSAAIRGVSWARARTDRPLPGFAVPQRSLCVPRYRQNSPLGDDRLADRSLALGDLFARLDLQRLVDDRQQRVVLPQAHAERDCQHHAAEDQPCAQLFEVVHEAEPILVADRADRRCHGSSEPITASVDLRAAPGESSERRDRGRAG